MNTVFYIPEMLFCILGLQFSCLYYCDMSYSRIRRVYFLTCKANHFEILELAYSYSQLF